MNTNEAVALIRQTFPDLDDFASDPGGWLSHYGETFADLDDQTAAAAISIVLAEHATTTIGPIDMAYDEDTAEEAVARIQAQVPGLVVTIVNPHGPGGGWPEVTLSGPTLALVCNAFLTHWSTGDEISDWDNLGALLANASTQEV